MLDDWLDARIADAPPALVERVRAALSAVPDHPTRDSAARLRSAADRVVAEAARAEGREGALILLTADALVTLECRWVAEHAPEGLADVR